LKVADLKVGELYKIRSDRKTHVLVRNGFLDVHLGHGVFGADNCRLRPFDHLVYLGKDDQHLHINRWVMYRGKKLRVYPNVWQHITPIEEEQ
tara:strand:- start:5 stop:280 length:276 start_codon:yes stop_codon:yes gene_type:complete